MFKRRIRAALAVTLALMLSIGGNLRFTPAAKADATPNYAQLWIDQQALMRTQWAPTAGLGLTPWGGGAAATAPKTGDVWHVTTVEQLCRAFSDLSDGVRVSIDADLDFNGVTGGKLWDPPDFEGKPLRIEGNGHTLYNLKVETAQKRNSSFAMNFGDGSEIRNLTFKNVILHAPDVSRKMQYLSLPEREYLIAAALFADVYRGRIVLENIGMENALVFAARYWAFAFIMTAKEQANTGDNFGSVTIENCYTRNVVCYAPGDENLKIACTSAFIGGGVGGTDERHGVTLNHCYAVESMVISGSGHSGGFSSCNSGKMTIRNCFSDVVVYGTRMTGAFQGVMHHGTFQFDNCFALGSVEGQEYIGGFAATFQRQKHTSSYTQASTLTFRNCYSGAITGMVGGGTKMGSFIGAADYMAGTPSLDFPGPDAYRFENCYAMGETGNIELDVSPDTGDPGSVGGFIGDDWTITENGTDFAYINCYYDKQTTAMREWAIGTKKNAQGISGVLTTDTAKAGRGLAGSEGTGGFADFPELDPQNPQWHYEGGSYPELEAFRSAAAADWRDPDLVRAYSAASVAAVHLDPWADLPSPLVYDTVRDLTVGFDLSGGVDWRQIPNPHRTAGADNPAQPTVTLYGETLPVLTLETNAGVTYGRNPAPGIQWLSANAAVNGRPGQRRLRVIPTANLRPGKSAFILTGRTTGQYPQLYDHADDVFMAYSSGQRLYSSDMLDITQGIYPDEKPWTGPQGNVEQKSTHADFTDEIGKYQDAATPNLVAGGKISVTGMRLCYVDAAGQSVDHVVGGVIEGGAFGAVDNLNLCNAPAENRWNDLFNGKTPFTNAELGLYALRYRWTLPDGRYLEGGKLVNVLKGLSKVQIKVEDMNGSAIGDEVVPGIQTGGDPALTGETLAELIQENIAYGTKTVAGWRHIADPAAVQEIVIDMGRDHFSAADTRGVMRVRRRYYTNFYMERDRMFVTPVTVDKAYTLSPSGDPGAARFLRLDQTAAVSQIPEFTFQDIEEDVSIRIRLRVRQIYINLRQIVRTPATVALPEFGYGKLGGMLSPADPMDFSKSLNVDFPTWRDTQVPPLQLYKRYRLPLRAFYRVTPIVAQYYALEKMVYDSSPTGAANVTTAPSAELDYRTKDEYWVTVYLQSKSNPNPNHTVEVVPNVFAEPIP